MAESIGMGTTPTDRIWRSRQSAPEISIRHPLMVRLLPALKQYLLTQAQNIGIKNVTYVDDISIGVDFNSHIDILILLILPTRAWCN